MNVTEEYAAGACGLDGDELTLGLLHENEALIRSRRAWKRQGGFFLSLWLVTLAVLLISLLFR